MVWRVVRTQARSRRVALVRRRCLVMTDLLYLAAETLPIWRGPAVMLLAAFVLACLWFAWGEE